MFSLRNKKNYLLLNNNLVSFEQPYPVVFEQQQC